MLNFFGGIMICLNLCWAKYPEIEIELLNQLGIGIYTLVWVSLSWYLQIFEKKGFEWWTGREWSNDITKYKYLCKKDDEIKTIEELHEHQMNYFKNEPH